MMQQTLSHYFGYETFRPGQEEIISKVLDHRNVLGVLPTGGGKSICYQVPGLLFRWYNNCNKSTNIINERSSGSIKSDGNSSCFFK